MVFLVGGGAASGVFAVVNGATDGETTKDRADVVIRAAAAVAAVAVGLLTWARLELSRHEHRLGIDRDLTERYGRAVDQLASTDELVRVGGVFAMERFALDAVRADRANDVDWRMAIGLLAALARQDSAWSALGRPGADHGDHDLDPPAPQTVREAVQAIARFGRRSGRRVSWDWPDLAGVIAPAADLTNADLMHANLRGANLAGAIAFEADLSHTHLEGANLTNASLGAANLSHTNLIQADLHGAYLSDANLTGADLTGAGLDGVRYDGETLWPEGLELPPPA